MFAEQTQISSATIAELTQAIKELTKAIKEHKDALKNSALYNDNNKNDHVHWLQK